MLSPFIEFTELSGRKVSVRLEMIVTYQDRMEGKRANGSLIYLLPEIGIIGWIPLEDSYEETKSKIQKAMELK